MCSVMAFDLHLNENINICTLIHISITRKKYLLPVEIGISYAQFAFFIYSGKVDASLAFY